MSFQSQAPRITLSIGELHLSFEPTNSPITIGRDPENDVVIDHPSVSSRHASLAVADGVWRLTDHSSHGSYVSGERVNEISIDRSRTVWLADPETGVEVIFDPEITTVVQSEMGPEITLEVTVDGRRLTFGPPDSPVAFGRSPTNEVVVAGDSVSARHGTFDFTDNRWSMHDDSTHGTFVNGSRISVLAIITPVEFRLATSDGPRLSARIAPTDLGPAVINRPNGATRPAPSGTGLRLTYPEGSTREFVPGSAFVVGRDAPDNDPEVRTSATNDLVSRQHARVSHDGTSWWLEDLGSQRGTYVDGVRVTKQRLAGQTTVLLGSPTTGERLVFEAAGVHRRRFDPKKLILAGGSALAAVIIIAFVVVRLGGSDGSSDAGNDVTRMKLATGLVIATNQDGEGYKGSSTVLCGDNLVLTNAHVAQSEAPGQGLLYGAAESPITSLYLAYPPNDDPDGIAVVRFRAEVVAYDGYMDVAVLRITHEASGNAPDIVDGGPIDDPSKLKLACADLPDAGGLPSKTAVDVYGYPGTTASDNQELFFEVQLDADSNELTSYSEDSLLGARQGWINLGRDIQGGNSGGLVARNNRVVGIPTRGDDVSKSQARPIDLARQVIDGARDGRTGDLATYLTPVAGTEEFTLSTADPGGCEQMNLADNGTDFYLSWTGISDDAHAVIRFYNASDAYVGEENLGRSPVGSSRLAAGCLALLDVPDSVASIVVFIGPNLVGLNSWDLAPA